MSDPKKDREHKREITLEHWERRASQGRAMEATSGAAREPKTESKQEDAAKERSGREV